MKWVIQSVIQNNKIKQRQSNLLCHLIIRSPVDWITGTNIHNTMTSGIHNVLLHVTITVTHSVVTVQNIKPCLQSFSFSIMLKSKSRRTIWNQQHNRQVKTFTKLVSILFFLFMYSFNNWTRNIKLVGGTIYIWRNISYNENIYNNTEESCLLSMPKMLSVKCSSDSRNK